MRRFIFSVFVMAALSAVMRAQHEAHEHSLVSSEEGLGRAHMETSCSPTVGAEFDRALALLHNFWYVRAFQRFNQVARNDPECAMAY